MMGALLWCAHFLLQLPSTFDILATAYRLTISKGSVTWGRFGFCKAKPR